MKQSISFKLTSTLAPIVTAILVLVPFYALLTVWAGSSFGHYTAWRLWDEILLSTAALTAIIFSFYYKLWRAITNLHIFWLIIAYTILQLIEGVIAYLKHGVTAKALGYGCIVDLRFLLFFIVCIVTASHNDWLRSRWKQILLIPAAVVIIFGLLQYFILPYEFLKHFGYGSATISPYETINHNLHYLRIMSTLRGANPLGAYLVIIISATAALFLRSRNKIWRIIYGVFTLAAASALYLSFSRSAWIGAALSLLVIIIVCIKSAKVRKIALLSLVGLVVVLGIIGFTLRNNIQFENIVTHTQQHSAIKTTSDQGHISALKSGLSDVLHQPLGRGPGTAGPESVYNNHPARIAENYFIQVGQEVGWLGLVLFILINWLVAKNLWLNRKNSLSLTLLASLIGITLVGFFSHVWVDDTLSYIWWGLAGIALAPVLAAKNQPPSKE